ncbi:MAG: DUF3168 domain-containing protein [Selenomonadaceae bacterium]
MILIRDIPLVPLQKALYLLLKNGQTVPIYGKVPTCATLPYITIGGVTAKPVAVKDVNIWGMSITMDVWGTPAGKEEVNETLNDISALITFHGEALAIEKYKVIDAEIDMVECFPAADGGYHGTLTAVLKLNKTN